MSNDVACRGMMLAISSPSGAGKTTICRQLLSNETNLSLSVSVTTRPPRPDEVDGRDYYFVSQGEFDGQVKRGELLESADVYGHSYGSPRERVESAMAVGQDVLFDVDWQGVRQLHAAAAADLVRVFVLPPSTDELERRLRQRAQDLESVIERRLKRAVDDIGHWREYDYVVVNIDIDRSVANVQAILVAERLKRERQIGLEPFVTQITGKRPTTARK